MTEISRGRKALFVAVLVLVAYGLAELGASALYLGIRKRLFSFEEMAAERRAIVATGRASREFGAVPIGSPPGSMFEVLHPYLGFVHDPTKARNYSDLGFPDSDVRIYAKDPNRVVIGILGGSFADGLSRTTKDVLAARLARSPRYAGKEIKILTLCMGGYKQPQQLLVLSYLLSLGAHFDVVVNLDGLNEVVLPAVENVTKGVSPFYPRNWYFRMGSMDEAMLALARRNDDLRDNRRRWAEAMSAFPLRLSVAANILWKARDRSMDAELGEISKAALQHRPAGKAENYSTRGPAFSYADEGAMYDDLVRMWQAGSIQMQRLASANGIAYLHFLQPNQYVPGTKEMGEQERAVAYLEGHPYQKSILAGYPRLVEAGRELRRQGVAFFDLTRILAGHKEPLYIDTCCHLEKPGYDIIAARIADEIAKLP